MARRAALVCEHLEGISRRALEQYQDIVRRHVRRRHGVYALYRKDELYYVGLANNLRSRLGHHLRDRHGESWDRFSVYLTIGDSHLKELESLVLRIVRPRGNKQKGGFLKSEDMRRRFAREVRTHQRSELAHLLGRLDVKVPMRRRTKTPSGRSPVLSKYGLASTTLRARHKGKWVTARVRRDGSIRLGGKVFQSPSLAAAAAVKRPTCNGWGFWKFQRAPGEWVKIGELRR